MINLEKVEESKKLELIKKNSLWHLERYEKRTKVSEQEKEGKKTWEEYHKENKLPPKTKGTPPAGIYRPGRANGKDSRGQGHSGS